MTVIENQVIETWRIHNNILLLITEKIPADALTATLSKRGGRDIARHLAHINWVRVQQLEQHAKKQHLPLTNFSKDESPSKK